MLMQQQGWAERTEAVGETRESRMHQWLGQLGQLSWPKLASEPALGVG